LGEQRISNERISNLSSDEQTEKRGVKLRLWFIGVAIAAQIGGIVYVASIGVLAEIKNEIEGNFEPLWALKGF
jgi:hypothetical protein